MKSILKVSGILLLTLLVLTGCRTTSVYNVDKEPISASKKLSSEQVYKAIRAAGYELGWNVKKVKNGLAQASISLRGHSAVVEIPYSTNSYSIVYKTSSNLKYDSSNNTIHKNYNSWVQNLKNKIDFKLANYDMM